MNHIGHIERGTRKMSLDMFTSLCRELEIDAKGKTLSLKSIVPQLNLCSALVVYQEKDRKFLEACGVCKEAVFRIPHGRAARQYGVYRKGLKES